MHPTIEVGSSSGPSSVPVSGSFDNNPSNEPGLPTHSIAASWFEGDLYCEINEFDYDPALTLNGVELGIRFPTYTRVWDDDDGASAHDATPSGPSTIPSPPLRPRSRSLHQSRPSSPSPSNASGQTQALSLDWQVAPSVGENEGVESDATRGQLQTVAIQTVTSNEGDYQPEAGPSRLAVGPSYVDGSDSHRQKRPRDEEDKENVPAVEQTLPSALSSPPAKRARLEPSEPPVPATAPMPAATGQVCRLNQGQCTHPLTGDYDVDRAHLNSHHDYADGRFRCTYPGCAKHYAHKCNRGTHVMNKHWGRKFMCDVPGCGRLYAAQAEIPRHKRTAHPP